MYPKLNLVILLILFAVSCQSTREFETNEIYRLSTAYNTNFTPDAKRLKETKKQLKNRLSNLERYMAITPDSIVISQSNSASADKAVVDSYYLNVNKISYIKRHKLESQHKILLNNGQ